MKLFVKSTLLFLFGVYVEAYKKRFDYIIDKRIKSGKSISSNALTKKANKSYALYLKFKEYEKDLQYEFSMRQADGS